MVQREWFVIGVRLLGVYILYANAFSGFYGYIMMRFGVVDPGRIPPTDYAIYAIPDFVIGLLFLFKAERLAAIVYDAPKGGGAETHGSSPNPPV